ncbi:CDP-glucose 4,6-dehydratase [bacterium]|nr:CDP-glucose 4,6-dehydratase [bacterium]
MEALVRIEGAAFCGRRVLVTGHSGFKGGWLCTWLERLGARVFGYALAPDTDPALYHVLRLRERVDETIEDIRNYDALLRLVRRLQPEIVFHLAAQPLVRRSYDQPKLTYDTNVGGTVNLLEALRTVGCARAVVVVTTDKVYENHEWVWGYRESDRLGGHDPYSSSKACAELAAASYYDAFFKGGGRTLIATARSGNVIGGGDWAQDRIVPDAVRALSSGRAVPVRNPGSVRPWQHVLEPLAGYLLLAGRLWSGDAGCACAWNFGPDPRSGCSVRGLVELVLGAWGGGEWKDVSTPDARRETTLLRLNSEKAEHELGWHPVYDCAQAIRATVEWYREYYAGCDDMRALTVRQIEAFEGASVGRALETRR